MSEDMRSESRDSLAGYTAEDSKPVADADEVSETRLERGGSPGPQLVT
ncbi:hypothetical protein [Haloarcula onubensis]|uniref:Uncharacterized protein n=1 Tax=Haloarcula onubensis TaxID=2950539 RepID=A0ABU2FLA0_9EURY|nr:hypothetical protein [Halomicroarcula sp. S3CR25-11]MDS0281510.1 hypothetical protein [Halomicroarcula sp. S3CR25-11]